MKKANEVKTVVLLVAERKNTVKAVTLARKLYTEEGSRARKLFTEELTKDANENEFKGFKWLTPKNDKREGFSTTLANMPAIKSTLTDNQLATLQFYVSVIKHFPATNGSEKPEQTEEDKINARIAAILAECEKNPAIKAGLISKLCVKPVAVRKAKGSII